MRVFLDAGLVLSVLALILISLLTLFSIGYSMGNQVLLLKQVFWVVIGLIFATAAYFLSHEEMINKAIFIYLVLLILTTSTLVFSREVRGVKGWFNILGLGIQPSEFLKVGIILMFAKILGNPDNRPESFVTFAKLILVLLPAIGILLLQPDLGMVVSYLLAFLMIALVTGINRNYILFVLFLGVSAIFSPFFNGYTDYAKKVGISLPKVYEIFTSNSFSLSFLFASAFIGAVSIVVSRFMKDKIRFIFGLLVLIFSVGYFVGDFAYDRIKPYQKNRIMIFFDPKVDRLGAGYNVIQSQIAVGSGGILGKGYLQGIQKKQNLIPEKHTDFIFSTISEEWGFLGSLVVILLFSILFYRLLKIMFSLEDRANYVVVASFISFLFVNFFVNISIALGLLPVTGLPLPFVSYGGSSLITNLFLLGLVLRINKSRLVMID